MKIPFGINRGMIVEKMETIALRNTLSTIDWDSPLVSSRTKLRLYNEITLELEARDLRTGHPDPCPCTYHAAIEKRPS